MIKKKLNKLKLFLAWESIFKNGQKNIVINIKIDFLAQAYFLLTI